MEQGLIRDVIGWGVTVGGMIYCRAEIDGLGMRNGRCELVAILFDCSDT